MSKRAHEFMVGIITIVALLGLSALLLLFGELRFLWQRTYPIMVEANTSAGLRKGSQVTLNGVVIGNIATISLDNDHPDHPVLIQADIDTDVKIPVDATPQVGIALLGGGQKLDLVMRPTGGSRELASQTSMTHFTADFDTLTSLAETFKSGVEEAKNSIKTAVDSLKTLPGAIDSAQKTFDAARSAIGHADEWMTDEQFREDVRAVVFNARHAAEGFGKIADQVGSEAPKLLASLTQASDQLSHALTQLDELARQAREGKGTVGRLMSDPGLYENLNDATERLTSVLKQAQLLLEKIRQEGLGVKF